MNILHYSLGFPPYRTGGMTKYCLDLISEQLKLGHKVSMIWPGRIKKYGYECNIKENREYNLGKDLMCKSYEIINPLPVPLLDGIKDIDAFTQSKDEFIFYSFLKENDIQVIHVHTLMGLPKECITAAKRLDIKVIYTTHDYFGICPKWGLIYNGKICEDDDECNKCVNCNKTALSLNKIKILQSSLYRKFKNTSFVKKLRRKHNDSLYEDSTKTSANETNNNQEKNRSNSEQYKRLRQFYIELLEEMDIIHFNSYNTQKIYQRYFSTDRAGKVLSITHSSISDNRKVKSYNENLNLGYLGPITEHKGFYSLKKVCDELYDEHKGKFKVHIFANYEGEEEYIVKHSPYKYDELESVMDLIDILVVPSLWNETFGFTVLEALSYGVPIILSNKVGAKDLIIDGKNGVIYKNEFDLKEYLSNFLNNPKEKLEFMNKYIIKYCDIKNIEDHCKEIIDIYI